MEKKYLIPNDGKDDLLATYCDALFINEKVASACANAVILQPTFSSTLIATLPVDQALAKRNAQSFKDGQGLGLANLFLSSLESIALLNTTLLNSILTTASLLDTPPVTTESYESHLQVFQSIISSIESQATSADPDNATYLLQMSNHLNYYQSLLHFIEQDKNRFSTDISVMRNEAKIAQLNEQLKELQQQYADNNEALAKGATAHLGKDIMFSFELTTELIGGEVNPELIIGVGLQLVGAAEDIDSYSKETAEKYEQQSALRTNMQGIVMEIEQDQQDASVLSLTAAQLTEFYNRVDQEIKVASSCIAVLHDWRNNLSTLLITNSPLYDNFFTKQVQYGITYWENINTMAKINLERLRY
jgi:hypothetical protein